MHATDLRALPASSRSGPTYPRSLPELQAKVAGTCTCGADCQCGDNCNCGGCGDSAASSGIPEIPAIVLVAAAFALGFLTAKKLA